MVASADQVAALAASTPPEEIGTRPAMGKSGGLSYVDARFVFDRFDSAVGPDNWQIQVGWSPAIHLAEKTNRTGDKVTQAAIDTPFPLTSIGVLTDSGWVWKTDVGDFSDIASIKGGVSDSIKRAAVQWGVARDLYPKPDKSAREGAPESGTKVRRTRKAAAPAEVIDDDEQSVTSKPVTSKRKTRTGPKAGTPQPLDEDEDVQQGLNAKQKAKLFAALGDAGVPRSEYKNIVKTITGKDSTTQMTNDDLDTVLTFAEGGEYKAP